MTEALNTRPAKALVIDAPSTKPKALTSILGQQGLSVSIASSGKDALSQLKHETPDVIFLDQTISDMDEFEVLKSLKTNNKTANIPVMLVTSKTDDHYLKQARSLGANKILPKNSLGESNIPKHLKALGLQNQKPKTKPPQMPAHKPNDHQDIHQNVSVIRQLLSEEFSQLRKDLPELIRKHSVNHTTINQPQSSSPPTITVIQSEKKTKLQWSKWLVPVFIFTILALATTMLLLPDAQTSLDQSRPTAPPSTQKPAIANNTIERGPTGAVLPEEDQQSLPALIHKVVHTPNFYGPNEQPLSDTQMQQLEPMLFTLFKAGFTGKIELIIHQGRFCTIGKQGQLRLPPEKSAFIDCKVQAAPEKRELTELQSTKFKQFLEESPLANGKSGITLTINPDIITAPLTNYPIDTKDISAGKWNFIARSHNRIQIKLIRQAP